MDNKSIYNSLGLDGRMVALTSLANRFPTISGLEFESQYEVQTNRMKASRVNLDGIVKYIAGDPAVGNFSSGSALNLATNITFNKPKQSSKTFGHPILAVYQGTNIADGETQIFPVNGTAVDPDRYRVQGFFDYNAYNGTSDIWRAVIIDTNGTSSQQITFVGAWLYVDYVAQDAQ